MMDQESHGMICTARLMVQLRTMYLLILKNAGERLQNLADWGS